MTTDAARDNAQPYCPGQTDHARDSRAANRIDLHVGRRLRQRRLELGMSQQRLAEELGVAFQQVQKYERGINRISAGRLHQLAAVLEVPIGYFFEEAASIDSKYPD